MVSQHFFFVPLCRKSLVNNERFHTCCYFAWSLLHRIAPVRSCLISNIWSTFIYDCWFCAYFLSITFFAHSVLLDVVFPGPAVTCPSEVAHVHSFCITTHLSEATLPRTTLQSQFCTCRIAPSLSQTSQSLYSCFHLVSNQDKLNLIKFKLHSLSFYLVELVHVGWLRDGALFMPVTF